MMAMQCADTLSRYVMNEACPSALLCFRWEVGLIYLLLNKHYVVSTMLLKCLELTDIQIISLNTRWKANSYLVTST